MSRKLTSETDAKAEKQTKDIGEKKKRNKKESNFVQKGENK